MRAQKGAIWSRRPHNDVGATLRTCGLTSRLRRGQTLATSDDEPEAASGLEDPLDIYIRNMRVVPLLTREGEVVLAKRLQDGRRRVWQAASRTDVAIDVMADLFEQMRNHDLTAGEVLNADEAGPSILDQPGDDGATLASIENICRLRNRLRRPAAKNGRASRIRSELVARLSEMRIGQEHVDEIVTRLKHLMDSVDAERSRRRASLARKRVPGSAVRRAVAATGMTERALRKTVAEIEIGERQALRAKAEMVQANLRLV